MLTEQVKMKKKDNDKIKSRSNRRAPVARVGRLSVVLVRNPADRFPRVEVQLNSY